MQKRASAWFAFLRKKMLKKTVTYIKRPDTKQLIKITELMNGENTKVPSGVLQYLIKHSLTKLSISHNTVPLLAKKLLEE